jgi:regulatory protein
LNLKTRALGLLARREHSRRELERKLAPHAESPDELTAVLDDLERRKQLSDERFAEARARQLGRKYGPARVEHDLRAKGVADDAVARSVAPAKARELELARAAWAKRFAQAPKDALEKAKQMRFLQQRGFSFDAIRGVVPGVDRSDLGGED